jgi:hypothetical protein
MAWLMEKRQQKSTVEKLTKKRLVLFIGKASSCKKNGERMCKAAVFIIMSRPCCQAVSAKFRPSRSIFLLLNNISF